MYNPVSYGVDSLTLASGVTLGFGSGQTAPPRLLVIVPTAATGIVLPAIASTPPTPPGTPGTTPGVGDGFCITVRNGAAYAVTLAAATGNTLADSLILNYTGAMETLQACAKDTKWYRIVNPLGAVGYRTVGGTVTVATTDRYINVATATTTVVLQAASVYPAGVEFVSIMNYSGSSISIAASGNSINTTASPYIVSTKVSTGICTDGVAFYLTHTA